MSSNVLSSFPIIQYADDTLLFLESPPEQLNMLKNILSDFAHDSGLKVNYSKSVLVPINTGEEKATSRASLFGCSIGSLPFTYLGMPLGLKKTSVFDLMPLVKKCEKRLLVTAHMLSQGGKLILVNSVLSSYPTFLMGLLKVHKTVIKQLDKYRKHLLWRGADLTDRKPPKAAWHLVCLPKTEVSLGVMDLYVQNDALLLKNLHKFFNKANLPWSS
jgi:hypothetical protein